MLKMAAAIIVDHGYATKTDRTPSFVFSSDDHNYSSRKNTPVKKRKRQCSTPTGRTPNRVQKKIQYKTDISCIRQSGERSKWSLEEKEYLKNFVMTSIQEDDESDNTFWTRCSKAINLRFPNSMRTGPSCRNAYNRLSIDPRLEVKGTKSSQATRNVETQTEISLIDRQRYKHSQDDLTEGEWVFWEPKKELKDDPSEAAKALHSVAVERLREYAEIKQTEKARLVDIIWTGSSKQIAREILSSSLGHQIKLLLLQDTELEAKDCASRRSVLHHKQYKNLKEFNWEEVVNEMIKKQTFLTEILLAVSFPTGKIGSNSATEAIVPVLGCVYGMLMKQRFHELSRLQRVISMALANEQTAQKVFDRLQPMGVTLSHSGMLQTMNTISGTFNTELIDAVKKGKRFRIVGDNINFSVGVSHERKSKGRHSHMEHWFGSAAIIQNVSFEDRSDIKPQCNLLQLPSESFLMNDIDWQLVTRDNTILVLRILTDFFPWLKFVKTISDKEIEGDMPSDMRTKNQVIPLEVMHKNEQKYAEVIDVLDYYQTLCESVYNSSEKETKNVHIGGDQLTRERFYGAKRLRAAALSPSERLENLSPITFELFHLQMTILTTFFNIFYNKKSTEKFTLHAQKIRLCRNDVDGEDVKNHYDACKDLAVSYIRAFVVEAACHHFGFSTTEEFPNWLPDYASMTDEEIKTWAFSIVKPILDNMMCESKAHLKGNTETSSENDAVNIYSNLVLEIGLIFLNLNDIIRNPSRVRLLCLMKYMMLVLKGHSNNSKYALEILRFLCQQFAILSEREACESFYGLFVNTGKALIPADLQMEYIVRLTKGHLRSMCSNKTDKSLIKRSSAFYGMDEISHNLDKENCVVHRAQKHRKPSSHEDEMKIIQDLCSVKPFSSNLRRIIPSLKKTLMPPIKKLNIEHILEWITFNKLICYHEF